MKSYRPPQTIVIGATKFQVSRNHAVSVLKTVHDLVYKHPNSVNHICKFLQAAIDTKGITSKAV